MKIKFCILLLLTCCFWYNSQSQTTDTSYILTPPVSALPRINGAKIFGVRPAHPIVYKVPVSGEQPIVYKAKNLPKGVAINSKNGMLSGRIQKPGKYTITCIATNKLGKAERDFTIVVGEDILLTPPLGWNSYNVFGLKVTEAIMLQQSKAMVTSGLINYGWSYMNMDDGWQGYRGGKYHAILPDSTRFKNIKALCDTVHAMGLKIGTYSTPWVESYGRRIGGSSMNTQGLFSKQEGERSPRNKKVLPYAIGTYTFVKNDVQQFAEWEFDYLKYDWNPIEMPETKEMYSELRNSSRDIALSLSNSTPFANIAQLSTVSQTWRTGGDIKDSWTSLKSRIFTQDKWAPFAKPGHWNDPDMMIVGYLGWGREIRKTLLTKDEQYTHMSAWSLMSVPLLLGCDLTKLDDFTISLLTNNEVLDIHQDVLGKQATVVSKQAADMGVMAKDIETGKAVGLFNLSDSGTQKLTVSWSSLQIQGKYIVRDVWRQQDIGVFENEFSATVPQHGVLLLTLIKVK